MPILEVKELSISFKQYVRGLKQEDSNVISSLNLTIEEGEVLAVVGASGSGKSLLAHAILGILPSNANITGTINYDGEELTAVKQASLRGKEIALIPQSVNYLDPLMQVGKQVRTSVNQGNPSLAQRKVFNHLKLNEEVDNMYPFQLSGGMARRVLLSTAIVSGASLIIADEPTPGLDRISIKGALKNFREFANNGSAVMLITHDIESALTISDKIAVFYAGTIVEIAAASDFFGNGEALRHPYTKALWRALPQNEFTPIPGSQPRPDSLPPGCLFAPRCIMVTPECSRAQPEMRNLRSGKVRCIHAT